jgi:predicted nucleic acid-binding protein
MQTARLFFNGRSQALRLPKAFRFEGIRLRNVLEREGTPVGPLDTQIAAHALAPGVFLVTNNTREFARVPCLRLENRVKR